MCDDQVCRALPYVFAERILHQLQHSSERLPKQLGIHFCIWHCFFEFFNDWFELDQVKRVLWRAQGMQHGW